MQNLTVGILAHVDAGKTTLSEALLFTGGAIRKMGRVDHKDAFLDTDAMEKNRGITIFSKQAVLTYKDMRITLLDTPGHSDFSAEAERVLDVLDCAVLLVSASDGVQSHTRTLWKLLERYQVPAFLFVNKMDQPGTDKAAVLKNLQEEFGAHFVDFTTPGSADWQEEIATADEGLLEEYLKSGCLGKEQAARAIRDRKLFPCCFGSALKMEGVREFLDVLISFGRAPQYPDAFAAKVFKIGRDRQGTRLTYMKITGGVLKVKALLSGTDCSGRAWEEKTDQIRIYSGEKYTTADEAPAGYVVAATGLSLTRAGEGLGAEKDAAVPVLKPVLTYRMILPQETDPTAFFPKLKELEEEEPELHAVWHSAAKEIQIEVMGEVQTEILAGLIAERLGITVTFGEGSILYRETIRTKAEGVGHFEPLRHYAEVHLLLSPGEPGSGLHFDTVCSVDTLAGSWQKLILTHLAEKTHCGVLTGFPITDMKITLLTGKAHVKHTEGGDFREATYRAVRQGLMQAESVLLEPYYEYRIEVPSALIGRVMTDLRKMDAAEDSMQQYRDTAVFTGTAPVYTMRNYYRELSAVSGGTGKLSLSVKDYEPCHNAEEVTAAIHYDPDADTDNPSSSVFCEHGAGFPVPWDSVYRHMHLEAVYRPEKKEKAGSEAVEQRTEKDTADYEWMDPDEVDAILERTYYANRKKKNPGRVWKYSRRDPVQGNAGNRIDMGVRQDNAAAGNRPGKLPEQKERYILIDGYNVIFAWEGLSELAAENIDAARGKLLDILCNYQGMKQCSVIAVFDAYRVKQHPTEVSTYHNISVVFTKTAETADAYIEKFAHVNRGKYDITVVTSDGLEQIIIRGQDCRLLSSRDFEQDVHAENEKMREILMRKRNG
jgi:ribosomal protection tetracycline resistance protein